MKDWEFEETIRWAIHDKSEMEANLKKMPSCVLCDGEVFDCIDGLYYCQSCGTQSQVTTSSFSFVLKCLSRSIQELCFTVAHNCHGINKYLTANSTTKPKSSRLLQLEWNCPFSCLT